MKCLFRSGSCYNVFFLCHHLCTSSKQIWTSNLIPHSTTVWSENHCHHHPHRLWGYGKFHRPLPWPTPPPSISTNSTSPSIQCRQYHQQTGTNHCCDLSPLPSHYIWRNSVSHDCWARTSSDSPRDALGNKKQSSHWLGKKRLSHSVMNTYEKLPYPLNLLLLPRKMMSPFPPNMLTMLMFSPNKPSTLFLPDETLTTPLN